MATKMEEREREAAARFVDLTQQDISVADISEMEAPIVEVHKTEAGPSVAGGKAGRVERGGRELVNCLRPEKVVVRFVPHPDSMVENSRHVLFGGMSEDSVRTYTVPMLSNGSLKNVLTKAEKDFLEEYLGLEYNAMSVHRGEGNFWSNFQVSLHKQDNTLDLSDPNDYIRYKVLLANKDYIAPSLEEMQDRPKASYEFVIVRERDEMSEIESKIGQRQRLYMEFGKISENRRVLLTVIRLMENKTMSGKVKTAFLQGQVHGYIDSDPKRLLNTLTDPMLETKAKLFEFVENGSVVQRGDQFYVKDGNIPMCGDGADPTLSNAARWLNLPKNNALYNRLQMGLSKDL